MKDISDFSTSVMWWNVKLIHMLRNFRFLLICHVQKFEISPRTPSVCPWQISGMSAACVHWKSGPSTETESPEFCHPHPLTYNWRADHLGKDTKMSLKVSILSLRLGDKTHWPSWQHDTRTPRGYRGRQRRRRRRELLAGVIEVEVTVRATRDFPTGSASSGGS